MKCPNGCPVKMEQKYVEKLYHVQGKRIIIKDLLVKICPQCSQEAIPLLSMKEIDSILKGQKEISEVVQADVYKAVS